jgi:transcriptional regulator GlxA family with amidase domain
MDALAPFEVLKNAAAAGAPFSVRLVTLAPAEEVVAGHGLRVRPDGTLASEPQPDLVVVPGGGWASRAAAGAFTEAQRGEIPTALLRLHQAGVPLASVCAGAMLLAAAGILQGRCAVTHHSAIEELRAAGVRVIPARVVDDGDIISSGGVTSGLDLALWLVERYAGPQIAQTVEQRMEYERRGTVWRQ